MVLKSIGPSVFLVASLAACSTQADSPPATLPPAAGSEADCGAGRFANYVGSKATPELIATVQASRSNAPLRVIKPGMAVTMDFRGDRLNIEVDESETIKRFYCS
ncbi:I78 family peptidase inhibitor [Novosphingobium panipatense]|uniref:Peptidase inhibitor I78 family protein n=1 Tax=Novosphingobium panipatense TaxID=428991 RepID=A0ABY1Q471_9SPHN|nr:Peptidase inhibitor I78 family protein [Novosphingobium panipatense]